MLLLSTLLKAFQLHTIMQFTIQCIDTVSDSDYIAFNDFLSTGEIKRCLTTDVWLTCPPDVVWEEVIDLLMKSALLLSAIQL